MGVAEARVNEVSHAGLPEVLPATQVCSSSISMVMTLPPVLEAAQASKWWERPGGRAYFQHISIVAPDTRP